MPDVLCYSLSSRKQHKLLIRRRAKGKEESKSASDTSIHISKTRNETVVSDETKSTYYNVFLSYNLLNNSTYIRSRKMSCNIA